MRPTIKRHYNLFLLAALGLWLASGFQSPAAPPTGGTPKTSQHASFKPEHFERLAVIVKPIQTQGRSFGASNRPEQGQLERMVEQEFLRVLIGDGYTLVSRADLDAAMKEKGLDQAHLTDEKLAAEAGKLLHVSALVIVSVDAFKTSSPQRGGDAGFGGMAGNRNQQQPLMQVVASVSARLVKIDDNMVMWTGDFTVIRQVLNQDQDSIVLASVAEAIAKTFPPLTPPAPAPAPKKPTTP
jgi:hypothetical protein